MKNYICIHGHFYQPPRENAWLEAIELQESAHPFHDWNERINYECYHPNTASRILNEKGEIIDITNNYSRISYNFGPTLLSWMEEHDPETYHGILEADRLSQKRFSGHGSAMGQVYNHMIMPLANRRDKESQVLWGMEDFEHRFKRQPEGMWLAETAVDTESLDIMAANGIKYTVLAPRQGKAFRLDTNSSFTDGIDTKVPYRYTLPSGKEIILFFYDGDISQSVAFNHLLNDGKAFADKLLTGFDKKREGMQLVNIATDGESYGHHHKHGDMALAYALDYLENGKQAELTNYGEYIELAETIGEAQIHENSSWSCVHGVERWKDNCGCHSGGKPEWNQKWRKPLRESLDWLRDQVNTTYEVEAAKVLKEPWEARNRYIATLLDRNSNNIQAELVEPNPTNTILGRRWLELQRNAMLMYTSCGWFFDEVSGIETTQILQYACRVIQLYEQLTGTDLEDQFVKGLSEAPSNLKDFNTAGDVYREYVIPTRLDLDRVGMHYAVSAIFEENPDDLSVFNFTAKKEKFYRWEAGVQRFASGIVKIKSDVTHSEKRFVFAVLYMGQHNIMGNISLEMDDDTFEKNSEKMKVAFLESRMGDLIGMMEGSFGNQRFTLWHLFRDQKLKVIGQIMEGSLSQIDNSFRKIYNRDYSIVNMMRNSNMPVPKPFLTTVEYVLNSDLKKCINDQTIDLTELDRIWNEFKKWGIKVDDSSSMAKISGDRITKSMKKLLKRKGDMERIKRLNGFFMYIQKLGIQPDLSQSQNWYFYIAKKKNGIEEEIKAEWESEFGLLGRNLGVVISK